MTVVLMICLVEELGQKKARFSKQKQLTRIEVEAILTYVPLQTGNGTYNTVSDKFMNTEMTV